MLLITVIVAGAVALAIGLGVALRSVGELSMGLAENQSAETLAIADGCVQEALQRLSLSYTYAGATLTVGDGSCVITVTDSGTDKAIAVTATIAKWTRKIAAVAGKTNGKIVLRDWKENTN